MSEEKPNPKSAMELLFDNMQSESIAKLSEALSIAQCEFDTIHKNKMAQMGFKHEYADFTEIRRATIPALSRNGLSVVQSIMNKMLITQLMHSSGEWIRSVVELPIAAQQGRNAIHNLGGAITYIKRYAYTALLSISADDDLDGNMGEKATYSDTGKQGGKIKPKYTNFDKQKDWIKRQLDNGLTPEAVINNFENSYTVTEETANAIKALAS